MKQDGFISSALLYGMLALFLVIVTSTLALLGNQKLGMDKLKEHALNSIQYGYAKTENISALYDGFQSPNFKTTPVKWKDQSGNNHDATLTSFPNNSYSNRHLTFNGTSYLDTGIKQEDLGKGITISTVLKISNINENTGLWGFHDNGSGIYAEIKNKKINVCYYVKTNPNPLCVEVGNEYYMSNLNGKIFQLTVVMDGEEPTEEDKTNDIDNRGIDVYVNNVSYDRIDTTLEINPHSGNLIIGKATSTETAFKGDIYNITIYNTALDYNDVMKNFEANRQRYNIPV